MAESEVKKVFGVDSIIFGYSGQDGRILLSQIYQQRPQSKCLLISRNNIILREGKISTTVASGWSTDEIVKYLSKNLEYISPNIIYYFAAEHQSAEQVEKNSISSQKFMYTNCEIPCILMNSCKKINKTVKFVYASSALIFANSTESPQNENSKAVPKCDYGFSKLRAGKQLKDISENNKIDFYNLIMYGHESIYRRDQFFTKKLISHLIKMKKELVKNHLTLFNPSQKLDIGYASEYMNMVQMLIEKSLPGEYIIASGSLITVRTFAMTCCEYFGIEHDDAIIYSRLKQRSCIQLHGNISKIHSAINYKPKIIQEKLAYQLCEDYEKNEQT